MEYLNQQYKLLPQVATAYVLNGASAKLKAKYQAFSKKANKGDLSDLPEVRENCCCSVCIESISIFVQKPCWKGYCKT